MIRNMNINKIIPGLILLILSFHANAQNEKGQIAFGLNAGFGVARAYVHSILLDTMVEDVTAKSKPALVFGADYSIHKRFSLGFQFGTQLITGNVSGHLFTNNQGVIIEEDYTYKARRNHISITPKFHYLVDNKKLDLYSGLRLGRVMWRTSNESEDPNAYSLKNDLSDRYSFGLIAFGAKIYFAKNFGANAELNFGPPYFFTFGLSYKIGGEN